MTSFAVILMRSPLSRSLWSLVIYIRADSRLAPSQWETSLQSNTVYHWLDAKLESALFMYQRTGPSSPQLMACRMFGAKSLLEPTIATHNWSKEALSVNITRIVAIVDWSCYSCPSLDGGLVKPVSILVHFRAWMSNSTPVFQVDLVTANSLIQLWCFLWSAPE